jgi:hypothetical protein
MSEKKMKSYQILQFPLPDLVMEQPQIKNHLKFGAGIVQIQREYFGDI